MHKVTNVLNGFPKSMQPGVQADLREIRQASTRCAAQEALDLLAIQIDGIPDADVQNRAA